MAFGDADPAANPAARRYRVEVHVRINGAGPDAVNDLRRLSARKLLIHGARCNVHFLVLY
jgi:hypothetical protein